ncbi:FAD-dependent thymidylate synthase [Thermaerobacter sp. PB12/4term]|uniref:FAD-dependent thymidylate synthase n=1 Tax=Thermaerobacter sp. PB12/4term TaxID=2293838 RepID=UPI000E328C4B|nr:FAD-dependent thymidylate synthase [Thermaerobacter sp. PB12/4term]QIA26416.1 FAD-dependent thymidylate synthase [Thermaerobacter sp. PB12/4term]
MSTAAERFTPRQRELLARFVSNLDQNVYAIYNLPEEVVAVIFAYVSRSPRSFRENLLRLMEDPELNLLGSLPSQPEPAAAGGPASAAAASDPTGPDPAGPDPAGVHLDGPVTLAPEATGPAGVQASGEAEGAGRPAATAGVRSAPSGVPAGAPAQPAAGDRPPVAGSLAVAAEKARRFHEKWVVGYGHASVAELAKAAVGIERISRLASARLETANPWLSFIEYSQRYQMPRRGAYVVPPELEAAGAPELLAEFHRVQEVTYDAYQELFRGLVEHLERVEPPQPGETARARASRLEKQAFEDARYALTLAVETNLGMVGNGRALRDAIVRLLSDPYEETTRLALAIRREVTRVLPTLVRYAEPNPRLQAADAEVARGVAEALQRHRRVRAVASDPVILLDWTGRGAADGGPPAAKAAGGAGLLAAAPGAGAAAEAAAGAPGVLGSPGVAVEEVQSTPDEQAALDVILGAWLHEYGSGGWPETGDVLAAMTPAEKLALFAKAVTGLGPHDPPPEAFKLVRYRVELTVSEASWHQLLRHSRRMHFAAQAPGVEHGITVPPRIQDAGLAPVLMRAVDAAERLFFRLTRAGLPLAAHYVVTNAHRRRVVAEFDLWQLYHLITLRGKPEAQWDIRQTVHRLAQRVMVVHPNLVRCAPRLMAVLEAAGALEPVAREQPR